MVREGEATGDRTDLSSYRFHPSYFRSIKGICQLPYHHFLPWFRVLSVPGQWEKEPCEFPFWLRHSSLNCWFMTVGLLSKEAHSWETCTDGLHLCSPPSQHWIPRLRPQTLPHFFLLSLGCYAYIPLCYHFSLPVMLSPSHWRTEVFAFKYLHWERGNTRLL